MSGDTLSYDVVIVGAGPAGLAAAIRLGQLCQQRQVTLSICVLEKGAEVGAHILSGAVIDPCALDELLPDWQNRQPPAYTPVTQDKFYYLTRRHAVRLPLPGLMRNHGNYIISLSDLCRWLGKQAESLGIDIFPGFAAVDYLISDDRVTGVVTGDMGLTRQQAPGPQFQPGVTVHCRQLLLAEGCRGSLSEKIMADFALREHCQPQTYAIGIKELWRVDSPHYSPGQVVHTTGWPLDRHTYGGSFIYHLADRLVAVGLVIGLDYQNPWLDPFAELQRFKTHPAIRPLLQQGERIGYGARALNEGGWQSIPSLTFPGGLLIGDAAGFVNVPRIKGSHTAMKSGMLAAETVFTDLTQKADNTSVDYQNQIHRSQIARELYQVRNIRPSFRWGLYAGLLYSALDMVLLRGKAPWTFKHNIDHLQLKSKHAAPRIHYPSPDGQLTFDKLSSVYLSNVYHRDDQPCHLVLTDPATAITVNWRQYAAPETRYCPACVYEIIEDDAGRPQLQINAQNCIHCKTCDIKDPTQNIRWVPPEGGGGPNYSGM
jgi:electron-transferring-flavoprotein dehydrogenase